jgi:heterodisulfide reductase subunit C2
MAFWIPLAAASDTTATADQPGIAAKPYSTPAAPPHMTLVAEVLQRSGINVMRCYQCGKCSAGCPMASEMSKRPHEVMHLVMRNKRDELLGSDGIWLCVSCETCSARCPNGAEPARVIDTLREIALEQDPTLSPRAIGAFHRSFLDQVKQNGRMFEVGLAAQYNLRSGQLLQDAGAMPSLFTRGKLNLRATSTKNAGELRRIFTRAEAAERKASKQGGRG